MKALLKRQQTPLICMAICMIGTLVWATEMALTFGTTVSIYSYIPRVLLGMAGWLVPFGVYMGLQEYLGRRQDARLAELDEQEKALSEKMEALDKKAEALRAANTSS